MNGAELIETIERAFAGVIDPELYDLTHGETDDPASVELATDDWTLVLESWPAGIGFLALDDEPESDNADELRNVVTNVVGVFLAPLRSVNHSTGGQIGVALSRTTDPLSNALAELMGEADAKRTPD